MAPAQSYAVDFAAADHDVVEWIIKHQLGRRNLTDSQRVILALKLRPALEAKAKENKKQSGGDRKNSNAKSVSQNSDEPILPTKVVDEIAKAAGVSHDTVHKVEKVLASAAPDHRSAGCPRSRAMWTLRP
ncbi:MAG: hypothetical protein NT013_23640 [Planctomycetia bacterium]|nr:hypothetical protein [Planctomycetia bacterium]